jgi:hypothetical protein
VLQAHLRTVRVVKASDTASVQLVLRVQADIAKRADELKPRVTRDRNLAAVGRITRSTVLKLALLRGLEVLEREYK